MTRLQFAGPWPWWLTAVVALIAGVLIWNWYRRESQNVRAPMHWLLPTLRALVLILALLMLAGPTLHHRWTSGELSRIHILVDGSQSMELVDEIAATKNAKSRWERAEAWLTGTDDRNGILSRLRDQHHVVLSVINDANGVEQSASSKPIVTTRWDSTVSIDAPKSIPLEFFSGASPLGDALTWGIDQLGTDTDAEGNRRFPAATLLITDGQSNLGVDPVDIAKVYRGQSSPIFTVGIGQADEPIDLGIIEVEHSKRVARTDRIKGIVTLKERVPKGTEYRLKALHDGQIVFERTLKSDEQALKRIDFDVDAEVIFKNLDRMAGGSEAKSIPIDLRFEIEADVEDVASDNNVFDTSLWGIGRRNRVLLLDQRGRWETRYIKNALDRDPSWELTAVTGPTAFEKEFFPESRTKLFDFDLLIVTMDSIEKLSDAQQDWITEFVELGGGIIFIDNARSATSNSDDKVRDVFRELYPFVEQTAAPELTPQLRSIGVTDAFIDEPALSLRNDRDSSIALWETLPVPKSFRSVEAGPGAEVVIEGKADAASTRRFPLLITKYFGQGRVLYCSTDETWRWRYNVADLYHQRFWNQISEWTMRAPFAMKNEYISLDSGPIMYRDDESVTVRAKLKKDDGTPLGDGIVNAIFERSGVIVGSVPLVEEPSAHGFYRATTGPWPQGEYTVRVEVVGVPNDALKLATPFRVVVPPDTEMQSLACNSDLLQRVAATSGGEYVSLDDPTKAGDIVDKLQAFQKGKVIESQTNLWQSYPWFITMIILLAIEWYLRKQAGLV